MEVEIEGAARPGMVTKDGLMICGTDGKYLCLTINLSLRLYRIQFHETKSISIVTAGKWLCVKLLSVAGKFVKVDNS